jgi:hypothetical protein
MRIRGREYAVDWGHLAFVLLIAAAVLWYLLDARSVSLSVNNLLLVEPVAVFALALCLLILPQCLRSADSDVERVEAKPEIEDPLAPALPSETRALIRIGVLGAALGLFVFSLNLVGFDIAIWLFALVAMLVCGERRPAPLLVYPLAVALVAVYGFRALMPYPMVTAIL